MSSDFPVFALLNLPHSEHLFIYVHQLPAFISGKGLRFAGKELEILEFGGDGAMSMDNTLESGSDKPAWSALGPRQDLRHAFMCITLLWCHNKVTRMLGPALLTVRLKGLWCGIEDRERGRERQSHF